jgi:hypothetical protein
VSVQENAILELLGQSAPKQVPQLLNGPIASPRLRNFTRRAEPHIQKHILRARAPPSLMAGTMNERFDLNSSAE